jgi:hypothetical protein
VIAWTVYETDAECGYCHVRVAAGDPVAMFTVSRLKRCASCARVEVDWDQVDQAKFEIERRAWAGGATAVPAPTRGLPPVRQPQPLSAIAGSVFDPKAAAAGDRDE